MSRKPLWLCQLESLAVGSGHTPHLHCCVVRLISRISWRFEKLVFSPDFFSSDQVFPNPYCSRTLVCRTKLIERELLRLAQQCKLIYDLISCFYSRHSKHFCRMYSRLSSETRMLSYFIAICLIRYSWALVPPVCHLFRLSFSSSRRYLFHRFHHLAR